MVVLAELTTRLTSSLGANVRVFSVKLADPKAFLTIKEIYFNESNRGAVRQHVLQETGADFVWFMDEDPPTRVIEELQNAQVNGTEGPGDPTATP